MIKKSVVPVLVSLCFVLVSCNKTKDLNITGNGYFAKYSKLSDSEKTMVAKSNSIVDFESVKQQYDIKRTISENFSSGKSVLNLKSIYCSEMNGSKIYFADYEHLVLVYIGKERKYRIRFSDVSPTMYVSFNVVQLDEKGNDILVLTANDSGAVECSIYVMDEKKEIKNVFSTSEMLLKKEFVNLDNDGVKEIVIRYIERGKESNGYGDKEVVNIYKIDREKLKLLESNKRLLNDKK